MNDPHTLDALAVHYGTDKSSKIHGYTRIYETHLAGWKYRPVRLLEIGVGSGGSLRMWSDYFPNGQIFGLDCRASSQPADERIKVFQGSQADGATLDRLAAVAGPFDVIIDDGSHRWSEQILALERLYPRLAPGGLYAIEDLHTSWWSDYQSGPTRTVAYLCSLVEEINLHGQSGYGDVRNDPAYASRLPTRSEFQATVQTITFAKSLALIRKMSAAGSAE
jgi:hypothetical protein